MMIPAGLFVIFTKNKGQYNNLRAPLVWLDEETQSMDCINLPDGWDDVIDRIVVFDNDYLWENKRASFPLKLHIP